MHHGFNNKIIKVMETYLKFQKYKKINLFIFNIRVYKLTRKTYSNIIEDILSP